MDTGSPRKIQFTMPLLDSHLDPEAAEQIRRRRPTPATLVASSDQSSPEIDEDRLPNQLYKAALMNSPRQRRKGARATPTMKGKISPRQRRKGARATPTMKGKISPRQRRKGARATPTMKGKISPRQRRKGARATPTMKELQFMVDHHLYQQQQQQGGGDECSSESCLSDRPSPDALPNGEEEEELELPEDEEAWGTEDKVIAEAFEKPCCQMEEFSRNSLSEATGGHECPLSEEEVGCSAVLMAATSSSQQQHALAAADTTAASTASPLAEKNTKTPNQAKQDK
ncbi:protein phosphatase 1 regulatory subunit 1A isoform X2 [Oncorhynchus mykiss]|uniref:protein phosphatase 1 regulatory subunit 1A isoform X2 n=1 Tax=Oncorhynchus mykiss TaxID=8022 RepID=UPI001878765A|nr:protein phosphatase 1 regulatory subunit 1A isoform X2 [Oncorhynchus mykiss]